MLAPDQRSLMVEALRPPDGYTFDRGIGTTFTLNLLTLLVAPLSLALHDVSSSEEALADPVRLLDGIRRHAGRLSLFTQAGYIAIPQHQQANYLYSFLENMVFEVEAPNGGLFHPKIWLLRFERKGEDPIYRFLCLSRNVGFSRSWDVILRLEGMLVNRQVGYFRNKPLADLISKLPRLAINRPPRRVYEDLRLIGEEVRKVDFRVPAPFLQDSLEFIPLGDRSHRRLRLNFPKSRSMVISPFLSDAVLREATGEKGEHFLFSEAESLKYISSDVLDEFASVFVLNDATLNAPVDDIEAQGPDAGEINSGGDPSRLHAKIFIFEQGSDAQWWIGSANATNSAFSGSNVEFLVGMRGKKSKVGINKLLGEQDDEFSLRAMLAEYHPEEVAPSDPDTQKAEMLLKQVRDAFVQAGLRLIVQSSKVDSYELNLKQDRQRVRLPKGEWSARGWPITVRKSRAHDLGRDELRNGVVFSDMNLLMLTSFIAFEVETRTGRTKHQIRFVLNLPIDGIPADRDNHIISTILSDETNFLRYIRFLLAQELGWLEPAAFGEHLADGIKWRSGQTLDTSIPLFEDLARTLSRSPEKIDEVTELVMRLIDTEGGQAVLPEGFEDLWEVVQRARKQIK